MASISLSDPGPSISHILVLPPHPSAVPAMTPTADNPDGFSWILDGGGAAEQSDPNLAGFDDIFSSALGDMDFGEAFQTTQLVTPGTEDVRDGSHRISVLVCVSECVLVTISREQLYISLWLY